MNSPTEITKYMEKNPLFGYEGLDHLSQPISETQP